MKKKSLELSQVCNLIESGPVILLSTAQGKRMNVMPMSWHTMIDFDPPLIGIILGDQNHSFGTLKATRECVINIPTVDLAEEMLACGNVSGAKVDKFEMFDLTPTRGARVKAPLIEECYANLECRVVDTKMAAKYNLFILQVVKAWVNPAVKNPKTLHHVGGTHFMIAGNRIRLKAKKQ